MYDINFNKVLHNNILLYTTNYTYETVVDPFS